jgi:hypothetical protein
MTNQVLSKYLNQELPDYEKCKLRLSDADFFIPRFSEHYMLFKYNYTIPQLKEICKHYKLPRSGSKTTLMTYIYNFLLFSKHATMIQKYVRGFLQRKMNALRGPAFLKRDLCVNDNDFFTLEEVSKITPVQFYSIKDDDGFVYGFDILSLWQLYQRSRNVENPYNRKEFPKTTYRILKRLVKLNDINTQMKDESLDLEKELELRVVSLFQFINTLGHYTDHSWFLSLNVNRLVRFYREVYDIWNHRAQISYETKARIYPSGNPFRIAANMIITDNTSLYELRKLCVTICENLTYYGITDDDKTLGAYYILTALTLQSHDAAVALPWLYQSVV